MTPKITLVLICLVLDHTLDALLSEIHPHAHSMKHIQIKRGSKPGRARSFRSIAHGVHIVIWHHVAHSHVPLAIVHPLVVAHVQRITTWQLV